MLWVEICKFKNESINQIGFPAKNNVIFNKNNFNRNVSPKTQ